jgi:predicted Fe-Mo cluster-binding NifX family protein
MKIAIPCRDNWISPVLDESCRFTIVEMIDGQDMYTRPGINESEFDLSGRPLYERMRFLKDAGVSIILCGAVSNHLARYLASVGFVIIPWINGPVPEVIDAFINDTLHQRQFFMPGCGGGRHRRRQRGRKYFENL